MWSLCLSLMPPYTCLLKSFFHNCLHSFYIIRLLISLLVSWSAFFCIFLWVIQNIYRQLHGVGCFCQQRMSNIEMKGKWQNEICSGIIQVCVYVVVTPYKVAAYLLLDSCTHFKLCLFSLIFWLSMSTWPINECRNSDLLYLQLRYPATTTLYDMVVRTLPIHVIKWNPKGQVGWLEMYFHANLAFCWSHC